jgi:hypothetical protein
MGSRGNIVGAIGSSEDFRERRSALSGARERTPGTTWPVLRRRNRGSGRKVAGPSGPSEHRWQRGARAADVVGPPVGAGDVRIVAAVLLSFIANTLLTYMMPVKSAEKAIGKIMFTNLIPGELQLKLKVHLQVSYPPVCRPGSFRKGSS